MSVFLCSILMYILFMKSSCTRVSDGGNFAYPTHFNQVSIVLFCIEPYPVYLDMLISSCLFLNKNDNCLTKSHTWYDVKDSKNMHITSHFFVLFPGLTVSSRLCAIANQFLPKRLYQLINDVCFGKKEGLWMRFRLCLMMCKHCYTLI